MYMNARSWEPWVERAQAAGFATVVPSWPYHDGEPAELRRHIDPRLTALAWLGMHNYTYLWLKANGTLSAGDVAKPFADIFMRGIANRTIATDG